MRNSRNQKCYFFSRIQKDVIRPTSWPPHPCIPTAPNQKVVLWKVPVFLPLQLSHILLQIITASGYPDSLLCPWPLSLLRLFPPLLGTFSSLPLVNFPWNPSELALPLPPQPMPPLGLDYALLCASMARVRHTLTTGGPPICGFCICEFTDSLKLTSSTNSILTVLSVICEHDRAAKETEIPVSIFPAESEHGDSLTL